MTRTRSTAEYRALSHAAQRTPPPCTGDPRFTLEHHELHPAERKHLADTICAPCPLWGPCRDYAHKTRPRAGLWAGRTYPDRRKDTR